VGSDRQRPIQEAFIALLAVRANRVERIAGRTIGPVGDAHDVAGGIAARLLVRRGPARRFMDRNARRSSTCRMISVSGA
jgi:hypothetical protein